MGPNLRCHNFMHNEILIFIKQIKNFIHIQSVFVILYFTCFQAVSPSVTVFLYDWRLWYHLINTVNIRKDTTTNV